MLYELLELAVNNALEHDAKVAPRLKSLLGKVVVLEIKNINQRVVVDIQPHGLELSSQVPEQADVTLSATIGALAKIGRSGMEHADLQPGELEIHGDPIVGQKFAQLISGLDVDWEGLLAEHFGDNSAVALSVGVEHAKTLAQEGRLMVKARLNALVKDDLNLLADAAEVESFLEQVDDLRGDADRLQVRLRKIQRGQESNPKSKQDG